MSGSGGSLAEVGAAGGARALAIRTAALVPPSLRAAVRFLTIVPVPWHPSEDAVPRPATLVWFPLVGLAIGTAVWGALLLPLPVLPGAALALVVWTALTGALHEDGFLDCADAALAPVALARRREILKDPHVGAHGATAGGLLLVVRFAALASVPAAAALVAPLVGRWCMALTLAGWGPGLREAGRRSPGLGESFAGGGGGARGGPATLMALGLLAALAARGGAARLGGSALVGLGVGLGVAALLARRLGGANGDVHGAAGLLAETAALWAYGFGP